MSLKQKAFKGLLWSTLQNSSLQVFSLIIFLILARLLSPETFGLIALANVFLAFMQVFRQQGFSKALIQRETIEPEHLDAAFWSQVIFGILLTVITFFGANIVAEIFDQPKLIPILQCLSSIFIINSLSHVPNALLERRFAFKIIAMRTLLATIISGTIGVVMAFAGYGVWSLVTLNISVELVSLIVIWSAVDWKPRWQFSQSHFQDLFGFGMSVLTFKFIKFFDKRIDNLLIGYFLGEVALGYYAIAYRILEVMTQLLVKTINKVALPTFSRLQTEPERFRQLFCKTTQFTTLVSFPVYFGLIVFAPELTVTLFGEKWLPAVGAMQILSLEGLILSLSQFHKSVFISTGKPIWTVKISFFNATANVIACLIAVRWGIVAVATGYIISSYLVFPFSQWAVNKLIGIKSFDYLKQFVTPVTSSGIMVAAIVLFKHLSSNTIEPLFMILGGTAIGILVYALCIRIFEPQLYGQLWNLIRSATSDNKRTA